MSRRQIRACEMRMYGYQLTAYRLLSQGDLATPLTASTRTIGKCIVGVEQLHANVRPVPLHAVICEGDPGEIGPPAALTVQ